MADGHAPPEERPWAGAAASPSNAGGALSVNSIHRILVANRSEIAIRVFRAATELGIPVDKVYSDEFAAIITKKLNNSEFRKLKTADVTI